MWDPRPVRLITTHVLGKSNKLGSEGRKTGTEEKQALWNLAGSPGSLGPLRHFYLFYDVAFQKGRVKSGPLQATETALEYGSLLGVQKEATWSPCNHFSLSSTKKTKGLPGATIWGIGSRNPRS